MFDLECRTGWYAKEIERGWGGLRCSKRYHQDCGRMRTIGCVAARP